ncbi:hypothetical protein [Streptomyces anulatus]|uniref:hypothetical protein n=1 Tax=Streptomyces anulatus TaxID=1892 RepID=UPI0036CC0DEF
MSRRFNRTVQILLGVVVLAGCGSSEGGVEGLDRVSYEAGFEALGGAYLPPSDEDRATVEARCEEMFGGVPDADDYVRHDWVAGCADFVENKDSRFSPK